MAAAGGGGGPSLDFSNPIQALIALIVIALVCYAVYKLSV